MYLKHIKLLVTVFVFALLVSCGKMTNLPKGQLLKSYDSPTANYTINIYLCNGGSTTDFSIRGELVDNINTKTKNIYWCYHEDEADVVWIDEENVMINGKRLNVLKDVYDFRNE